VWAEDGVADHLGLEDATGGGGRPKELHSEEWGLLRKVPDRGESIAGKSGSTGTEIVSLKKTTTNGTPRLTQKKNSEERGNHQEMVGDEETED